MDKNKPKLAFSLIELSVVILIIGVLVVGITQGTKILNSARLSSAKSLTQGSPVSTIDNLVMWLETTSDKSFDASEKVDTVFGATGTITSWNDISLQATSPNNATQNSINNKPRYIANGINGLPVVNFDGALNPNGDYLNWNGTSLANSNYTIFVVEQRRSSAGNNYFIGGINTGQNQELHLGYRTNTLFTFAQYSNDYDMPISGYTSPIAKIHSFTFNSAIGKNYYLNGQIPSGGTCITTNCKTGLSSYLSASTGLRDPGNGYFNGDIGEIIVFNKFLNNTERTSVEDYLKTKWRIK